MIVDTSAIVALLLQEDSAPEVRRALEAADRVGVSAGTALELSIVMSALGLGAAERVLEALGAEIIPVDPQHLALAREAHARFGRGSGSPARLNFGDCFSYAAARAAGRPLLFVGDDFTHTDADSVL